MAKMDVETLKALAEEVVPWQIPGPWGEITWHQGPDERPRVGEWEDGSLSLQLVCLNPRKKAQFHNELPYYNVCFTAHELLEDGDKPEHFTRRLQRAGVEFVMKLRMNRALTAPAAGVEPSAVEKKGCCGA